MRIPRDDDPELRNSLMGQYWYAGMPCANVLGRAIYSRAVLLVSSDNQCLQCTDISVADDSPREIALDCRGCLIPYFAEALKVRSAVKKRAAPGEADGSDRFRIARVQAGASIEFTHYWLFGGKSRYCLGNYGVEFEQDGPAAWILRFCEGIGYIQFDALVVRVELIEDRPINEYPWGDDVLRAAESANLRPTYWKGDEPQILNPRINTPGV